MREVGPRDGLQNEPPVPVADRIRLIDALSGTGLRRIEAASFVRADAIPPMAGSEEVMAGITRRIEKASKDTARKIEKATAKADKAVSRSARALERKVDDATRAARRTATKSSRAVERSMEDAKRSAKRTVKQVKRAAKDPEVQRKAKKAGVAVAGVAAAALAVVGARKLANKRKRGRA